MCCLDDNQNKAFQAWRTGAIRRWIKPNQSPANTLLTRITGMVGVPKSVKQRAR